MKSPARLLIYGLPKIGKTGKVAELDDCLTIDLEKGTLSHEMMAVQVANLMEFNETLNAIREENKKLREGGSGKRYKYKYICIDTVDELESFAEQYQTAFYNADVKKNPKNADGSKREMVQSIYDLPYGKGYYYVREEVKARINAVAKLCERLIMVAHIKDKELAQKTGFDIKDKDISLTGKLSQIVTAVSDAIGFVYRDEFKMDKNGHPQLMLSFETATNNATMGARPAHLRGKHLPFEWENIYID